MKNNALEKHTITVEVNPVQLSVLMDLAGNCLPDIQLIMDENLPKGAVIDLSDVETTIAEIYIRCFVETELMEDAKRNFKETGEFPDFNSLVKSRFINDFKVTGPGEFKPVKIEVVPTHVMFAIFLIRGYFDQFTEMIGKEYSDCMFLDYKAMRKSIDDIYEKSIAITDIREKTAPVVEAYEMTGQMPDLDEVFRDDSKAN